MVRVDKRRAFRFHFGLVLILFLAFTVMDIMMWRARAWNLEATGVNVPGTTITLNPFHVWVTTFLPVTIQAVLAGAYYFYTRDKWGTLVLLACTVIFIFLAVGDILFFQYQGQAIPENWSWLYWQNEAFGSPLSGTFVLAMASFGLFLIFGLYYLRLARLGRRRR